MKGGHGRIRVRAWTILGVNLLHINQIQIILIFILVFFCIYFRFLYGLKSIGYPQMSSTLTSAEIR